ncbi:PEP-CTERM sorting domain-containing protein [Phormidium sp. CLA17]|uniref:amidase family protein n=1 Tax=Leptolyngbya sp. Cla-17 TaxID=2803751 RepID=UPI001934A540|nr:amidase family protein [Leptolyngbya sp. Cla-17]MBM0743942.1 PEP-CTERM sorting domain-containing protein [Leptolyngbya sp. Cla-17]
MFKTTSRFATVLAAQAAAIAAVSTPAPAIAFTFGQTTSFTLQEATISNIQSAFESDLLTSKQLVQLYLSRIETYDAYDKSGPGPQNKINSILTLNPNALAVAEALDLERQQTGPRSLLHGVPILLKDNIDTFDLPTTAGSVALAGSIPPDDAFIAQKLREAGAVILGKANLTEYANYLTNGMPAGYSSLGGYVFNPYNPIPLPNGDGRPILSPGGSSAGSAAAIAANFAAVSIGTETSGSILSPANQNSLVGVKPTLGLASRDGIIPIAASQDTAGPLARTVTDAAILLGAITGVDPKDAATAGSAGKTYTDYTPFLNTNALSGARIGVPREFFWTTGVSTEQAAIAENALSIIRSLGAEVVEADITTVPLPGSSVLSYEFKRDLNLYLGSLGENAPIKTLADVIAFNSSANPEVALKYGQVLALASQARDLDPSSADTQKYLADRAQDLLLSREQGIDAYLNTYNLDAIFFPGTRGANIAARAGYPSVIVPAGYQSGNAPFGITFSGTAYSEPTLLGLAYAFEQATLFRRAPESVPSLEGETVAAVPEPTTVTGLLLGVSGLFAARRRQRDGQRIASVKTLGKS